ncbi:ABC transporter, ATP-binding protein [Roseburia inulinivorans DSM 16841]|uniref:ABC transporter, ATP-binding protein n=1 Tax=Roseburia inulinivorans DSM 16841 TaxID=622312 RepID=C0FPN5_9FIRM|nr:oligopeptide/dipeptide ABC transporter ATP-binding protein [Roseburia inulinivorans]EEG95490.1 ABC transporter, ATP-binding protein [Roseburia inulinivorans DSM 16841]MCC3342271.1 ATP-binding cassette domain-containing protein [Roseburia inulinivorans DSM 16841]
MEDRKVLLSVKDLIVKFHVRGRVLTAIRGVSLDIYENESIAIVGESGSGKSVFTKTFAGMLDSNGFIDNGKIIFSDEELSDTVVKLNDNAKKVIAENKKKLDEYSRLEFGADTYKAILELESEKRRRADLSKEEAEAYEKELLELKHERTNTFNLKQTYDPSKEKDKIKEAGKKISELDTKIKAFEKEHEQKVKERANSLAHDTAYNQEFDRKMAELKAKHAKEVSEAISAETEARNEILAKEVYLSVGRFGFRKRMKQNNALLDALKEAMKLGVDLSDEEQRNAVFDKVTFRVKYLDENSERLHGICILNLANIRDGRDWSQIRGTKIATVFQDPMTSLNPIITIGKQITSVIMKHQDCTENEARLRALDLMDKVGIPNPEARFDDYPFQYSGGMRQRIVIAIALSCQPKILICDEPTTALDVTIQAQILKLLKDLQKEFNYTIVFITHDLGVVANIADRVAVLYAGQIVEVGTVEEVFYDPRHPYTWALLSSLPQLAERNTTLYSITGTPPSLYNSIVGDAFAPRNPYCMKIDTLEEPPMFKVTDTHYAKTWLLHPDAPKVEKPEGIQNIHEKLVKAFNI